MRVSSAVFALVMTTICVASIGHAEERRFLSWYNGYGGHEVWGLGFLGFGSYDGAFVQCGSHRISVTPIYDTHVDRTLPSETQSQDFARKRNLALQRALEAEGTQCEFQPSRSKQN